MMKKIETVCVIDDDDIYQIITTKEIEETALVNNILLFSDGEKAIRYIETAIAESKKLPDIIFLDLNMPVMDGWDFLDEFLVLKPKMNKKVVLYIVSSSIDNRDIDKARSISAVTDFIIKPITKNQLASIFNTVLKQQRA